MEKCRLCLKHSKNLKCIFNEYDGIRFADMVTSITNVKVSRDDGISDQICLACRRKARESYDFKLQVERSHEALQENCCLKRINFSNLCDINFTVEITECDFKRPMPKGITENIMKDSAEPFNYNDIIIKKVSLEKKKPLSVIDFLKSIKEESEDDYSYEVEVDYDPDLKKDPDFNVQLPLKKKKERTKADLTILRKPVVPVFLADYTLMPEKTKPKIKKAKDNMRVCPYCGKLTKKLQVHLNVHSDEKPYKCDKCSIAFRTIPGLKRHLVVKHAPLKLKCDLCTGVFTNKMALKSHLVVHSNEKKYVCNICSKAFKRRAHLLRHVEYMHSMVAKNWECEQCPDTFKNKYSLTHHMRVHTRERPYKCEICSQPYSYKHDFNRHCLKKHGVSFYRRTVHVMNEEVLLQERILMRDLMLRLNGILKDDKPVNPFEGPQAVQAFDQMIKVIQSGKVVVDLQL